jgi:phage terminase small subunit
LKTSTTLDKALGHNPPATLTASSKAIWRRTLVTYNIDDEPGRLLLSAALHSLDRAEAAAALVKKQGLTFRDRHGGYRANPACAIERDARRAMVLALKALNIDLEPLNPPGRPPLLPKA